jgi:peptidoglycan/xylan/chitin deacetylase (PgdA/CDA1 family)
LLEDEYEGLWSDPGDGIRRTSPLPTAPPKAREELPERPRRQPRASARRTARRRRRTLGLVRLGVAIALLVGIVLGAVTLVKKIGAPSLTASGPPADASIGPAQLPKLAFSAQGAPSDIARQRWSLDGTPVTPRVAGPDRLVYRPSRLGDGEHHFQIVATGGFLGSETAKNWTFTVDTAAPKLRLDQPAVSYARKPIKVSGTVDEDAVIRANGRRVQVVDDRFTIRYATPPSEPVTLTAADSVGNTSNWRMPITVVARRPREPIRAVHVSADGWASSVLRQGVLQMIDDHRINAVELDLKDEAGVIGWDANVPLGKRYGAVQNIYDLKSAVEMLHAKGVRVIGRLVAFRDPKFAEGAWQAGDREEVIQAPGGTPYASTYGGFSNFANPAVRKYNIRVAVAAAKLGVDDILYDYVRRPDGPISTMVFPGLKQTPEKAIADFLAETRKALRPYGTYLGASVFGIAATRPDEVAQDIPMMAREVDYVSPMVYPSHWAPGEYQVADPNSQPYEIVRRSLDDFTREVKGTGARVVPWLQDFSLGVQYGPRQVEEQIKAAHDAGVDEFTLWDPEVTYSASGVARDAKMPSVGTAKVARLPVLGPALIRLADSGPAVGPTTAAPARAAAVKANELGLVPVLMHHRVLPDRTSEYDVTPKEFRAELQRLWKDGYVPITAGDYVSGKIDVPAGKKPVVMTFDDGSASQFGLTPDGQVKPDTAVGIMLAFAKLHPDFPPAGTFYVNKDPFEGGVDAPRLLRWLVQNGFEVGNHTLDHAQLNSLDDEGVQKELADEAKAIESAVPGYTIRTMALPYGAMPNNHSLAVSGSSGGESYGPYAVMLVGANPAPSPFATDFDPAMVPRIRTAQFPWRNVQENYAFDYWLTELEHNPGSVYVSDGDPNKVSFPESESDKLSSRFESHANTVK